LADGNRARRARFPVPDADSASRSLRRGAPSFSSRLRGCRFASELAYRSHVAHSRAPALSEGPLCCALFERDCKLTSGALMRSALTEIPSPPVLHRTCSAKFRRLARSSEQGAALLRSCWNSHVLHNAIVRTATMITHNALCAPSTAASNEGRDEHLLKVKVHWMFAVSAVTGIPVPYPFAPLNHFTVPFSLTDKTPFNFLLGGCSPDPRIVAPVRPKPLKEAGRTS